MQTQTLSCTCQKTAWSISGATPGRHVVCYCADCQSFARHLKHSDMLAPHGGTHIWQTVPGGVHITRGAENLACLRLSPKGMNRWYAACCDTPVGNTLQKATPPFVGLILPAPGDGFGPVKARVNTVSTRGAIKEHGFEAAGLTVILRAIGAYFTQKARGPFFDAEGRPPVEPRILSVSERNAARGGPAA